MPCTWNCGHKNNIDIVLSENALIFFIFRVCASAREGPAGSDWREAVASEIRKGQQTIVSSLLQHRNSRYFQHDFLHAASKQRSQQEIRNEDENPATAAFSYKATENLNDDRSESWGWDGDSVLSLTSSLPSSLSTDPPPSLFSYSSYETQKPCNQTAMSSIDATDDKVESCVKSCVDVRNMSNYSWLGPNKKTVPTKQEYKKSDHTETDILDCEIDFSDENPKEIIEENDVDYAFEFNELKQLVHGCGFSSILDLHLNISNIIERSMLKN